MPPSSIPVQVNVPEGYRFGDLQLEMSLKPFYDTSAQTRQAVVQEIFTQWQGLWRHAESISILLMIAEGSEILEYDGNPETAFEWARYHGAPNRHRWEVPEQSRMGKPDHSGIGINTAQFDPEGRGIHSRAYLYRPQPAVFTYRWLRDLVADIKSIGAQMTGRPVYVGNWFDIGPEFALSRFKFDWHREILSDGPMFKEQFVSCEAVLKGDSRRYAAFPEGIPEGTGIGTFLGRQERALAQDCGFDFMWLSNGFGFSLEPWSMVGEVFDGSVYRTERSKGIQERILRFWRNLRHELPEGFRLRTRGTNMATGIDLGSDASPLKAIYEGGFGVDAPVNSPWAALDGDFGLEISGWMSHIVRRPGNSYRFRFYIHDPWWLNSPWLDRYARQPHDIYLPLSVSRLQSDGSVETARDISLLTIDDSHGRMPLSVPNEVTAHILRARETAPDATGPLLWVYPFDEYHRIAVEGGRPDVTLHADSFISAAINEGVPLNTVLDASALDAALAALPAEQKGVVLVSSVPTPASAWEQSLLKALDAGGSVLLYGPLEEGSAFLALLGLRLLEPLEGDFVVQSGSALDECEGVGQVIRHTAVISAGGWSEAPEPSRASEGQYLQAAQGDQVRVAVAGYKRGAGVLGWTRASLSTAEYDPLNPGPIRGPILQPLDSRVFYPAGRLLVAALKCFGWEIGFRMTETSDRAPYLTVHRHRNACILCGHQRDEHTVQTLRLPLGAPLLLGRNNRIAAGRTEISGQIAWLSEVRVFVSAGGDGVYAMQEPPALMHGVNRRLLVHHCRNATLKFLIDPRHRDTIRILRDPYFPYFVGEFVEPLIESTPYGEVITIDRVDGSLLIEW